VSVLVTFLFHRFVIALLTQLSVLQLNMAFVKQYL